MKTANSKHWAFTESDTVMEFFEEQQCEKPIEELTIDEWMMGNASSKEREFFQSVLDERQKIGYDDVPSITIEEFKMLF